MLLWIRNVCFALVLLVIFLMAVLEMTGQGPHGRHLPVLTVNIFAEPLFGLFVLIAGQPLVFIPTIVMLIWWLFKR